MSLFGMMNDLEEDPIFGHHMRSMRQMSTMLNSFFTDPFGMMGGGGMEAITGGPAFGMRHNAMMPFMPPTMNRLLNVGGPADGASFSSSSVISMSSGPNGPQVYQATSSTRTGPGGIKETRKTVQDSRTGMKKMAIGHHIGDRAHIIEREQNVSTGMQEERQDFINLDDEEAEDFDREFHTKARTVMHMPGGRRTEQLALPSTQPTPTINPIACFVTVEHVSCTSQWFESSHYYKRASPSIQYVRQEISTTEGSFFVPRTLPVILHRSRSLFPV
uniref:Myeloid leukemia factor n=1 Tax=Anopheles minimus TaxID=112268 RepID=A0A182W1Y6_9DIPT